MAFVSLNCCFSPFRSNVTVSLGAEAGFVACATGAGGFATGGTGFFAACGARAVTFGSGTGAGAGREVAGGGDVTAGCGVPDALVVGGGATCARPAQVVSPRIA